jgi:diketogulonate reductase-like aldo/keto reductase
MIPTVKSNNGIQLPQVGFGVFQIPRRAVLSLPCASWSPGDYRVLPACPLRVNP